VNLKILGFAIVDAGRVDSDAGADGVIIPHVNTADEVCDIVRTCLYPPDGSRSVGLSRAQKYGLQFEEYMEDANQTIVIIPQIEHIDGVQNIEEIVKVSGIAAIFIGPYDLSGSLGKLGEINDPQVQKNIAKIKDACTEVDLPVGIFSMDSETASSYVELGFTLITVGMDILFIGESAKRLSKNCVNRNFGPKSEMSEKIYIRTGHSTFDNLIPQIKAFLEQDSLDVVIDGKSIRGYRSPDAKSL